MWGGRFSRRMLPELERFSASLEVDFELYPFDIAGSVAHARGLAAAGIITPAQLKAIERGLRRVKRELDEGTFEFAGTDEDNRTELIPLCFDGATPALDGLCNRLAGLFSRHTTRLIPRLASS